MPQFANPLTVPIIVTSSEQLTAVYCVLGGADLAPAQARYNSAVEALQEVAKSVGSALVQPEIPSETADGPEDGNGSELDANGEEWDENLHASSRAKNADGTWRAKRVTAASKKTEEAKPKAEPETSDEDEFAAFRDTPDDADEPVTDAQLASAANTAAQALGSPNKVKALIAKHVPEGDIVHSRNIPLDKRSAFMEEIAALTA